MLFQLLADSFFATAILLCALMYLDYALRVYGQKLYVARGRQFVEMESYELNPMWREIVEKQLYWHPRALYLFAPMVTIGFAIGPILLLQAIWSMQRRHAKLQAAEEASTQAPSNRDARPNWTNDQGA